MSKGKAKSRKPKNDENVTYQNKDITSKILGENLKNKSFAVYGLDIPKIVDVLPTNLPAIEANELRLDNLFLLEDGSLALVDYESSYADEDKVKYLNYIVRTLKRYLKTKIKKIRMIVIYTADVEAEKTHPQIDVGCLKFEVEEAFLTELDSNGIEKELAGKIRKKKPLTPEEQMQLLILPLTHKGKKEKRKCVQRCFDLAKRIEDEEVQTFVLSGMLVFSDKIITREDSRKVREWIMMTKVGQLFEEEKLEYAKKTAKEEAKKSAKVMIKKGFSISDILEITPSLTQEEVESLRKEIEVSV